MRKTYIFIALAMVAALTMVSCKNNKKAKEPTQEEVQAQKVVLADSVLAKVDECAERYINYSDEGFMFDFIELNEREKMIKPDYLLEPGEAPKFITKEQKVNAFAIYYIEYFVRTLYGMPTDEVEEVIIKLGVDLNHPVTVDFRASGKKVSEMIREDYRICKERGDLTYFWQFQKAILKEMDYLLAKNPELFVNKVGEKFMNAYVLEWAAFKDALVTLAPYDEEIALIIDTIDSFGINMCDEEIVQKYYSTVDLFIESYKNDVFNIIEKRNDLLL